MAAKLQRYLKLEEMNRWHPDKLNRRTGDEHSPSDESIGRNEGIKAIWAGIETLMETLKAYK